MDQLAVNRERIGSLGTGVSIGPHINIDMDCSWFVSLEQAFRESMAWQEPNPEGYEVQ
jgi:hypothetical protein